MARNSRVPIQETVTLPSHGRVYDQDLKIPETVTIRAMTTLEEKIRLSSNNGFITIPKILERCIEEEFDTSQLKVFDLMYLMYRLRVVTYGSEYKVAVTCPHCGNRSTISVNLDTIPVNEVPEDFHEPFEIALPVSKDVLGMRLLTTADYLAISNEGKRIKARSPEYVGDPEMIPTLQYETETKNGEPLTISRSQKYFEDMHARDLLVLNSKYEEVAGKFGMDLLRIETCPVCGEEIRFTLPVTEEFFRPKYD